MPKSHKWQPGSSPLVNGSSRLTEFLKRSASWKHLCDPTLGHAYATQWCLSEKCVYGDDDNIRKYSKKWWSCHLSQCSPCASDSNGVLSLLYRTSPSWRTDVNTPSIALLNGWRYLLEYVLHDKGLRLFHRGFPTFLKTLFVLGKVIGCV